MVATNDDILWIRFRLQIIQQLSILSIKCQKILQQIFHSLKLFILIIISIYDKQKYLIVTFEKLKPASVWPFAWKMTKTINGL